MVNPGRERDLWRFELSKSIPKNTDGEAQVSKVPDASGALTQDLDEKTYWVVGWEVQVQEEDTTRVRGVRRTHDGRLPVEQVISNLTDREGIKTKDLKLASMITPKTTSAHTLTSRVTRNVHDRVSAMTCSNCIGSCSNCIGSCSNRIGFCPNRIGRVRNRTARTGPAEQFEGGSFPKSWSSCRTGDSRRHFSQNKPNVQESEQRTKSRSTPTTA